MMPNLRQLRQSWSRVDRTRQGVMERVSLFALLVSEFPELETLCCCAIINCNGTREDNSCRGLVGVVRTALLWLRA